MKGLRDPERSRFPEDEQRQPWLPLLLDAYAVSDAGMAAAITAEERRRGVRLACGKGCSVCCRFHPDIPVYPLELVGIYWYVIEKLDGPLRPRVKQRLASAKRGDCPFLLDDACAIHEMRPMACRHFNVFGERCGPGEDAFHTRRGDVLTPPREVTDRAFAKMLPFYGVKDKAAAERALRSRMIDSLARVLQNCNWNELALRMQEHELRTR